MSALSNNKTTALYTVTAVYAYIEVTAMHAHAGVYYTQTRYIHRTHSRTVAVNIRVKTVYGRRHKESLIGSCTHMYIRRRPYRYILVYTARIPYIIYRICIPYIVLIPVRVHSVNYYVRALNNT